MEIGGEVDDFEVMKKVSAALVDGDATGVVDLTGVNAPSLERSLKPNVKILPSLETLRASAVPAAIVITNRMLDVRDFGRPGVILRPKNLVAGVGCHRGTSGEETTGATGAGLRHTGP